MDVDGEILYDDETGDFVGGLCWGHNIQDYEEFLGDQQEQALKRYRTILDVMPHKVWSAYPDFENDWASKRWWDFIGMNEEQAAGLNYLDFVHPDDRWIIEQRWKPMLVKGFQSEMEARYRRHDGIFRWMVVRACPFKDDNGKILKYYGTCTDVHDQMMERIEAKRHKEQMFTVLAHAEVNLFSIDRDRKFNLAEGNLWEKLKCERLPTMEAWIGKDVFEFTRGASWELPGCEKSVLDILSGQETVAICEDVVGDRTFRTRVVPELEHSNADGGQKVVVKGALGLSIDVTDEKARVALEMENTRLILEEQAASESNCLKSQFLANMSHEMRTPTAGIIGMLDFLGDTQLSTEQREYFNSIEISAKALLVILEDVLVFSKIESGRLDVEELPFNLAPIVGELSKILKIFANQKGLDFVCKSSLEANLEVIGDPGRTRQVLTNLLTNALKFTREGMVKLSVSAKYLEDSEDGSQVLEVLFVVEDTGIGIEKKVLDQLFEPFKQGDASTARLHSGSGLGLTISRDLAKLMHGSVEVESQPSSGTKATLLIPLKVASKCALHKLETLPSLRHSSNLIEAELQLQENGGMT